MNLVIDIGNTTAKLAVFEGDTLKEVQISSNRSLEHLDALAATYPLNRGIVSSVAQLDEAVILQLNKLPFKLLFLDHTTPLPIRNLYKTPETLGMDRIAAAIGANSLYPNRDILVIDAGTAITYEFIDSKGNYHGGNISPGLNMRLKALHTFTDKLPLVSSTGETPLLGYDTHTAIRSGVVKGMEFEIDGYIRHLKINYPELLVFLTGGDEFSFDTSIKSIIFADRFLVLKGLNRILDYDDEK